MTWILPDQRDRLVIVTGANSGLGLQIATQLAAAGAAVVLACRNVRKADDAAARIRAGQPDAKVRVEALDLADLASVRAFGDRTLAERDHLDLLINNAGLMAVDQSRTVDGFEMQLGVNHLGHFALTNRLLPLMVDTRGSRVATMSSFGHRAGRMNFDDLQSRRRYRRWNAYFQSKLANLLFTASLQKRLSDGQNQTIAVAAHPGFSRTDLGFEGAGLSNRAMRVLVPLFTQPVASGVQPLLRAATDPAVVGGQFYGPRFMTAGRPVRETPSRRARNTADAERLWSASAELTGVDHFS